MMSSLFCTYWLEVMLRVSFLWVKLTRGSPWLNGWLVYQMLQTVFCCWSKFSGDMNCPSALSITKQHLFPPSLALKLMNPVMCSFTNMPRDLIMIQALKHFLFMNVALSFITQSVKVFMLLFLVHSFVINHGMVLKMAKVLSLTSQFIEVNWNWKGFLMTETLLMCLSCFSVNGWVTLICGFSLTLNCKFNFRV